MAWVRPVAFVAPAVGATSLALKARYSTPEQHSSFLAMWCLGPMECVKTIPWRLQIFWRLRLVHRHIQTLSAEELALQWRPKPHDVVVAVPAKSGTTMLLQAAHQLRMAGAWGHDVDFEDQMDVIPMLEGGPGSLLPTNRINQEQLAEPRIYKSHLKCKAFDRLKVKRVYCFRDLKDVLVSDWRFTASILESPVPLETFAVMRVVPGGVDRALKDLCDWWEHRHESDVCFLFFEDVLEDRVAAVERLQGLMELKKDKELAKLVAEQCSHTFMSENHRKFDDHKIIEALDRLTGVSRASALVGKVRKDGGKSGEGAALPLPVKEWLDWRWECIVHKRLGFKSLVDMRAAWAAECRQHGGIS
ncbi:SULT1B1 [Symbiodinium natans]|uniref:SULT1B1 protein n=1 Tax=Symbiodinium natans TaxID=878477 RepID=A0A812QPT4_9DINO|nr:SULT1B1 [Symbiodinium natans]